MSNKRIELIKTEPFRGWYWQLDILNIYMESILYKTYEEAVWAVFRNKIQWETKQMHNELLIRMVDKFDI